MKLREAAILLVRFEFLVGLLGDAGRLSGVEPWIWTREHVFPFWGRQPSSPASGW